MSPDLPYGLGRLPSPPDPRDYRMADAAAALHGTVRPAKTHHSDRVLQQGTTPHCVGFAWAGWGICSPVEDKWHDPVGHIIYARAKIEDGEPGAENGSTIRSGAKVMAKALRIGTYFFAESVDEALDWLAAPYGGPIVFGTLWYAGMFKPSPVRSLIVPTGEIVGGHAWLAIGVERTRVKIRNSWGTGWGAGGDAWIRIADLKTIFAQGGEACAATERPLAIGRPA